MGGQQGGNPADLGKQVLGAINPLSGGLPGMILGALMGGEQAPQGPAVVGQQPNDGMVASVAPGGAAPVARPMTFEEFVAAQQPTMYAQGAPPMMFTDGPQYG